MPAQRAAANTGGAVLARQYTGRMRRTWQHIQAAVYQVHSRAARRGFGVQQPALADKVADICVGFFKESGPEHGVQPQLLLPSTAPAPNKVRTCDVHAHLHQPPPAWLGRQPADRQRVINVSASCVGRWVQGSEWGAHGERARATNDQRVTSERASERCAGQGRSSARGAADALRDRDQDAQTSGHRACMPPTHLHPTWRVDGADEVVGAAQVQPRCQLRGRNAAGQCGARLSGRPNAVKGADEVAGAGAQRTIH